MNNTRTSASAILPVVIGDVDANTVDANDTDQQAGLSDEIVAMLETLRHDDMTANDKRAMVATMVQTALTLGETFEDGGGESKTSGDTPAGLPSPERVRNVERAQKLLGILYETYRPEMYYYEAIQMVFKVLLWTSLAMFDKGKVVYFLLSQLLLL